jgi:class 3 adenylate cyclase/tetratricopeptide (TPR) repeat protein
VHRVIPQLIMENYREGRFSGEFPAVALFLDLSGFSTMTDALMKHGQHGSEVLAGLMHGVFDPLVESIFAYSGKIVSFAGDGIMALFPIEADAKPAALAALASAWEIQQRLEANPERQTIYGRFQFSVRIGIAVGTVAWGILRSEDEQNATYYFRGVPVDEAARAEQHARSGEIIVTDEIIRLLDNAIITYPLGRFHRFAGFQVKKPIGVPTIFPPIDLEVARIFIPEKIIVQDLRGEFRQIVNLFMRFPDLPTEKLHEFFHVVFELHKKYGGLLNRLDFGDKGCNMLMLWGAPVAYENDISRALNFILDLQSRVDFPITTGVTYYVAHAGYLGSVMCEDYTCYGWGVNLASRFMMSAMLGQTWVDDRIARRVSKRFDISYIGAQQFKGFSAEQTVNLLNGRKPEAELNYQGELIGRENEFNDLVNFVEPVWTGNFAGMLLVLGEAGIGKGRFVHEFRSSELFKKNTALWAICQTDQIIRQSFNPLRSWLLNYFGLPTATNPAERKQIFESKLQELIAATADPSLSQDLDRLLPALGAVLDLHWLDSLFEQLDAEGRYNSMVLGLITLIKAESLRQPLILRIEDMQFIDGDTLNLLLRLKRSILAGEVNYPIGMIATSRPYGSRPPPEGLVDTNISLKGLTLEEVARLTEILLGGVPAVELVKLVMDRSEGNPYFVEQIIRYLQEENLIEISQVGWNKVKRTREFFLPGDIRALLLARLDQLAHEVKDVVQTASVLGREFALSVLIEMVSDAENIERIVDEAQQSEIWIPVGEDHYLFTHGLLRDAAYTMQMRARRQELHRLAVDALEKIYANELRFHYAELAYHAERAELRQKAQHYYARAGTAAAELYRNSQAIDYFTRALAFTEFNDLQSQFELLTERIALFHRAGERPSQAEDLDSLQRLAEQLEESQRMAKVEMLRAHYCFATGDYLRLIEHAERVIDTNVPMDVSVSLDTYAIWSLGLLRLGKLDSAMQVGQSGLELAQASGERVKEGHITNSIGLIALEQKDPAVSKKYLEHALRIAREVGDRSLEAKCLNNLGNSAGFINYDYASARKYYEEAYTIVHERGDRSSEGIALGNLGWSAGMQGDFLAARSYHERALIIAREVGNIYQETYTLINLSAVAAIQQDARSSLDYAREACALSRKAGERSGEAWALLYLGYGYIMMDDLEQAEKSFQASILIREELGQPTLLMEPLAGLIEIRLKKKDHVSALNETEMILTHLSNGSTFEGAEEPLRIYFTCYLALRQSVDPRAKDLLKQGYALLESQLALMADDEARRMYVENVPWRRAVQQAWLELMGA